VTPERAGLALESPLLDSHEVAAYLKVSESTLSRWRSAGGGPPFVRLGGVSRYRHAAVDAWLAELERTHAAEG
jgi:excisionase family DNA binding protein